IDALIIVQGTDTLEETAFILDLLIKNKDIPIILTGSMRNPTLIGSDGAANLLSSVQVGISQVTRGLGVTVVFNDEIHAAQFVSKKHTQSIAAFQSYPGSIGYIAEGYPYILTEPKRKHSYFFKNQQENIS